MWIDDLKTRVEQSAKRIGDDIGSYLGSLKIEPTVLIGQAPQGNPTAAEAEASRQAAQFSMASNLLLLLSVAGVAYLLISGGKGKKK